MQLAVAMQMLRLIRTVNPAILRSDMFSILRLDPVQINFLVITPTHSGL